MTDMIWEGTAMYKGVPVHFYRDRSDFFDVWIEDPNPALVRELRQMAGMKTSARKRPRPPG